MNFPDSVQSAANGPAGSAGDIPIIEGTDTASDAAVDEATPGEDDGDSGGGDFGMGALALAFLPLLLLAA